MNEAVRNLPTGTVIRLSKCYRWRGEITRPDYSGKKLRESCTLIQLLEDLALAHPDAVVRKAKGDTNV